METADLFIINSNIEKIIEHQVLISVCNLLVISFLIAYSMFYFLKR